MVPPRASFSSVAFAASGTSAILTAGPSCSAFLPAADAVPAPNDTGSAREMTSIAIMTYVALFMWVTSFWLRTLAATRGGKPEASDTGLAGKHYQRWRTISRIQDTKAWTRPRRRGTIGHGSGG